MSQYITKIRTESGDLQIDYNALANLPTAESLGAATQENFEQLSNEFNKHMHNTLSPDQYGDELPPAGTVGRFFFKKVDG